MSDVIAERKVVYPKQPWLWNPDWALGRALPADRPGTIKGSIIGYAMVGTVVLVGTLYLIYVIVRYTPADEPFFPVSAVLWGLALLLGSFGLTALYIAVRRSRSMRRFGAVWLALETNPALLGGKLRAALRAANGFSEDARASMELVCSMHSPPSGTWGTVIRGACGAKPRNRMSLTPPFPSSSTCPSDCARAIPTSRATASAASGSC